jgi:membrane fusion protein, multidrug efflux system
MKRKSSILVGLMLFALLLAIGYGTYGIMQRKAVNEAKEKTRQQVPELTFRANELTQPKKQALGGAIEWTGTVNAADLVLVKAKVGGTLSQLKVTEGASVKAGQVIASISIADAGSRLAERDASLQAARSALKAAQTLHESNKRLAEKNFISPVAVESSRNQLETAQAQVRSAQAALDTTNTALREAVVVSPMAGKVIKRQVSLGEKVSPEQALVTVASTDKLEVIGSIGLHQTNRVTAGQTVSINIEGITAPLNGKIERIGPAAEAGTRSMPIVVKFTPIAGAALTSSLTPGQFATLQAAVVDSESALTIPVAAVQTERGLPTVWLLQNNQLKRRVVKLGKRDPNGQVVEVLEGLTEKDSLLASRFDNLRDGQKASVQATATKGS